jgi:hypothetical protein
MPELNEITCYLEPVEGRHNDWAKLTAYIPVSICSTIQETEGCDLTFRREDLLPLLDYLAVAIRAAGIKAAGTR